ncbi:uncharacterized protein EAF01_008673 [Botrytis porri]|uniref:Uncharacterized protein n=1 Tax=Botrytis porri TaxID=87229 RepID=A0A4Z1KUS7_9HELO|nr:uncharacterized protein EAF01_008673 [Botrytis porri]KAF7897707.1 hypothetical protein EAF01_008673 [Botrytis porri]TGO88251.1 hypothetical protein BPOR_0174g00040 [Botrytis porri]
MHAPSINILLAVGLLFSTPFTSALAIPSIDKKSIAGAGIKSIETREIPGLINRHHTEAQIAAKEAKAKGKGQRDVLEREAHHTEAQIASKEAKAGKKNGRDVESRHHTEAQIAAKKTKASKSQRDVEEREPHHTEAQIAAKKAKASKNQRDSTIEEREPHHTEAQIAAEEAKAGKFKGQ